MVKGKEKKMFPKIFLTFAACPKPIGQTREVVRFCRFMETKEIVSPEKILPRITYDFV